MGRRLRLEKRELRLEMGRRLRLEKRELRLEMGNLKS
jgi:hypothetical protein